MGNVIIYSCIFALTVYSFVLLFLIAAWHRLAVFELSAKRKDLAEPYVDFTFSVIIPVRNEAENILLLLKDLSNQSYDFDKFEVIVVDDHSEDQTASLVESYISKAPYKLKLLKALPQKIAHKKHALHQGISSSKNDFILTTDGDCRVLPTWIAVFNEYLKDSRAVFVAGAVRLNHKRDIFALLQACEFASLIGTGATALQIGFPFTCNGANLCYSRKAYLDVGGYEGKAYQISSGDDEFLLHQFHQKHPQKVKFLKSEKAIVETEAAPDWNTFYQQRKRWASKWNQHKKISHALISVGVLLIQCTSFGLLVSLFLVEDEFVRALILCSILTKFATEGIFIVSILSFLRQIMAAISLPFWWLIYGFYALFFGIVAQTRSYQWKNRTTK